MTITPRISRLAESYLTALLIGDRPAARKLLDDSLDTGLNAHDLLTQLIWPVMEQLQARYKHDHLPRVSFNMATRLNRALTDWLVSQLPHAGRNGRKVVIVCGDDEPEELGGQIVADLFEASGWTVRFCGGGIPTDEIMSLVGVERPNLLLMFATLPQSMPQSRKIIDDIRRQGAVPNLQIMCAGGIYKRAEGLAEEIGADLFAPDPLESVEVAMANPEKRASVEQQTVGRMRRLKKAEMRKTDRHAA